LKALKAFETFEHDPEYNVFNTLNRWSELMKRKKIPMISCLKQMA
jgi:hypothetical protein